MRTIIHDRFAVYHTFRHKRSVQSVGDPCFQLVQNVVTRSGFDTFVSECFLGHSQIAACQLGSDKTSKVMWFDVCQPGCAGIFAHNSPDRNDRQGACCCPFSAAIEGGKQVITLQRSFSKPALQVDVGLSAEGSFSIFDIIFAAYQHHEPIPLGANLLVL